jgi:hypothetical protein
MGEIKLYQPPTWEYFMKEFGPSAKKGIHDSVMAEGPELPSSGEGNQTLKAAAELFSGDNAKEKAHAANYGGDLKESEKKDSENPYWKSYYEAAQSLPQSPSKPPKKKNYPHTVSEPQGGIIDETGIGAALWKPNALTLESMLEIMQSWFLSASSNEAKKLWDVITCLRGPDSPSERASQETDERESNYIARRRRKYNTVEIIRHCAFKNHVPGSARSHKGKEIILPKDTNKWDHFDGHCWKAAQALGLKVVHKDLDYFTEGDY